MHGFIYDGVKSLALNWPFLVSELWPKLSSDFKEVIFYDGLFHTHTFQTAFFLSVIQLTMLIQVLEG